MYASVSIRNFRHFKSIEIEGFRRVNLIAGLNNVGKTALLEALFTLSGAPNPEMLLKINATRRLEEWSFDASRWSESAWDMFYPDFDTSRTMQISAKSPSGLQSNVQLRVLQSAQELQGVPSFETPPVDIKEVPTSTSGLPVLELLYEKGETRTKYYMTLHEGGIKIHPVPPKPAYPAQILTDFMPVTSSALAQLYGKLEVRGQEAVVVEALRIVEPRLERLTVVSTGNKSALHGRLGKGRLIPLFLMGGGAVRLATLVIALANNKQGILYVDEIENGLHHSVLDRVWTAIGELSSEFDVQIFVTTHSHECIESAHAAFKQLGTYDFCMFRLDRIDGQVEAVALDKSKIETALEADLEVRGYE